MSCKMPWWAGSENPPPDKDKIISDLRAEVASLKEELARQKACNQDMVVTVHSLTQQLAAAKEYAEQLIVALEEIADDSAHAAAQDALALPKPWDAIRKSEG